MNGQRVRQPAVAGSFYPGDPVQLRSMVRQLLDRAPVGDPSPCAMVVPHAGYVYSGYTAACAYRNLDRATPERPLRVILLSPSHRIAFEGISVGDYRAFLTPLGEVEVDQEGVQQLASLPDVERDTAPHQMEHALEVHLPFLQETVVHFRLVPIVFGRISGGHLADLVARIWRPGDLLLASTDLSHYHTYEEARRLDRQCLEALERITPRTMEKAEACGNIGVCALLELARRRQWRSALADYRTSGDTAGDKDRVVGYVSYLFYPPTAASVPRGPVSLASMVRNHLTQILRGESGISVETLVAQRAELANPGACFVTLSRQGQLRGCIGSLQAHRPLAEDLLANSRAAALQDPRFPPVTAAELVDLLSRLQPGVHGVILSKGPHRATFLPQVWEQLPDPETFLQQLSLKAGLPRDGWRDKPDVAVYTVQKIVE
ncbi:MAG: AmmeMemoRadiSam system protein B [Magnetococcus sp. MYC-9]